MTTRRGITLIEIIVMMVICVLLLALGTQAFFTLSSANAQATGFPPLQTDANDVVNQIAGALRRAPLCTSGGTVNAAVQAGTASSISICTSGTAYKTYSIDGSGNYQQATGTLPVGGGTTVSILKASTVALTFKYCLSKNTTYNAVDALSDTTANNTEVQWTSGSLSSSDLPKVLAVKITATVTRGGKSISYTSTVRLRNSPVHKSA